MSATIAAYMYRGSSGLPRDLSKATPEQLAGNLTFSASDWIKRDADYVCVGEATISVKLASYAEVVDAHVKALREHQKKVQADAAAEVTRIEGEIQKLLAITNEVKA